MCVYEYIDISSFIYFGASYKHYQRSVCFPAGLGNIVFGFCLDFDFSTASNSSLEEMRRLLNCEWLW